MTGKTGWPTSNGPKKLTGDSLEEWLAGMTRIAAERDKHNLGREEWHKMMRRAGEMSRRAKVEWNKP